MSLWVACSTCREPFPAETHFGLVRCEPCNDRAFPRLQASPLRVVEVTG